MKASSVLDVAGFQLNDAGFTRWTEPELLIYISEGQREAGKLQPASTAKRASVKLTRGETVHQLPVDSGVLIDIKRNMGNDGSSPGRPITIIDVETLNLVDVKRHEGRGKTVIKHFAYDPANSQEFETYPKASEAVDVYVEAVYSQIPDNVTDGDDDLTIINEYVNALTEYVLSRAFGKDTQYAGQDGRAEKHYKKFLSGLGIKQDTSQGG